MVVKQLEFCLFPKVPDSGDQCLSALASLTNHRDGITFAITEVPIHLANVHASGAVSLNCPKPDVTCFEPYKFRETDNRKFRPQEAAPRAISSLASLVLLLAARGLSGAPGALRRGGVILSDERVVVALDGND